MWKKIFKATILKIMSNLLNYLLLLPLISIFFLFSEKSIANASCDPLKESLTEANEKQEKLFALKQKNQDLYEKYKDDINKKIKISSNLIILETKIEEIKIKISNLGKNIKEKC
ncbi:MAG: hypothetical protein HQK51_02265 [Oligoflexia bacterium]|nr:hypothetical protein [Oligoflexia bacterium]